ncbi:PepSY domain-containing protein [Neolewinella agarilytica]|uniref:PepSY domain-containing protein n=1 Tax=Neolewinella agarilytica TaxID=478744 RepID=UPI002354CEDB|nr:PepSY domain-containing protein [Neolewinella agarilytica]
MAKNSDINIKARVIHRYLGFFLAGIMFVYALSGIVLIFRKTDFLKKDVQVEQQLATKLPANEVGKALKLKDFTVDRSEGDTYYFKGGSYNAASGVAVQTKKQLPFVLNQMTHLHKATTNDPLYYLNIFFGFSLLFFVLSAFWMFRPNTDVFRKGMYFTIGGIVLTLILLFV